MERPTLDVGRHVKYWQRCFKSPLPTDYTSTDSSRTALGFFILGALDLLGVGVDKLSADEVKNLKDWVLGCQHPHGGFCGSPNHKYPDEWYIYAGNDLEPANLPATFFSILSLNYVGSISDVHRVKCLKWLKTLQRDDGSFGEVLGKDGKIEGGRDMRYSHFAAAVRWMLRGDLKSSEGDLHDDIDVEMLVNHIRSAETYDGGLGETSEHESHAGYTCCGISALASLDRLPESISQASQDTNKISKAPSTKLTGLTNVAGTTRWLLSRQLACKDTDEVDEENVELHSDNNSQKENSVNALPSLAALSLDGAHIVGCNGRLNKLADTCYCYWVGAALNIIGQGKLFNSESVRRYLIEETQHRIGGFGKQSGYPPDLYHSYLGLAALAIMKEPGLKEFDPILCISLQARKNLEDRIKIILEAEKARYDKGTWIPALSDSSQLWSEAAARADTMGLDKKNGFT